VIVVDASVLLAAEDVEDRHYRASVSTLDREHLASVDLAWYEVTNVADRVWADAAAGRRLRARLGLIAAHGRMVIADAQLAERVAQLIREHELSAYDAAYVAAATASAPSWSAATSATSSPAAWPACPRCEPEPAPDRLSRPPRSSPHATGRKAGLAREAAPSDPAHDRAHHGRLTRRGP